MRELNNIVIFGGNLLDYLLLKTTLSSRNFPLWTSRITSTAATLSEAHSSTENHEKFVYFYNTNGLPEGQLSNTSCLILPMVKSVSTLKSWALPLTNSNRRVIDDDVDDIFFWLYCFVFCKGGRNLKRFCQDLFPHFPFLISFIHSAYKQIAN